MRYMGLDLSLTSTGICIVEDGKDLLITSVKTTASMDWFDRIYKISSMITQLIKQYDVNFIAIENYSYGSVNGREVLGELHGVVMYSLYQNNIPFIKISPTQVKQFGCGRGQAPKRPEGQAKSTWAKKWVVTEINTRYDKDFRLVDNDMCDAFIIALLAEKVDRIKREELDIGSLPEHQQQALANILGISLKKPRRKK